MVPLWIKITLVTSLLAFQVVKGEVKVDDVYDYDYYDAKSSKSSVKTTKANVVTKKTTVSVTTKTPSVHNSSMFEELSGITDAINTNCTEETCGKPLFLTPFLNVKDIETAVQLSKVSGHSGLEQVRSYSGFLTVNNVTKSHIFFWFFPALDSETSSPMIVWLQGGPGQSGLHGLFNLHGPYTLDENLEVQKREFTWAASLNMLYFDNPFGVGFSFTEKDNYPHNQEECAEHLYNALSQFFALFPDYTDDHIYICGEGYGAKFAVSLAHKIHSMGRNTVFNLKGIALGNPILDQETLGDQGHYLYELGLLDEEQLGLVSSHLQQANYNIRHYSWTEAMNNIERVLGSPYERPIDKKVYLPLVTGLSTGLNILELQSPEYFNRYLNFIQHPDVRKAIHVGGMNFQSGKLAYNALREDIPQSVKNWLATILDNYRVLFYGGNLDSRVPYSLASEILHKIRWRHLDDYKNASRLIWKVDRQDRDVAGYVHHVKNFFDVMIRNSGHEIAHDQPRAALDMMNRFIWGRAFIVHHRI